MTAPAEREESLSYIDTEGLAKLLVEAGREGAVFVPNSGNAGDSLIAEATYQFLDGIGLSYTTARLTDRLAKPSGVIIGGGGNLVAAYPNVRRFLERNLDLFEWLVILPHTIQGHEDILARLDDRCTIVCREQRSLDFCKTHAPAARIHLADDMALLWSRDQTRLRARRAVYDNATNLKFHVRNAKHLLRLIGHGGKIRNGTLNAFRKDVESRDQSVPANNIDLSQVFSTDSMSWDYSACAIEFLARFIGRAERVRTDRLHISILSALLGKAVEMHDNSYGKNRAVYEQSLASRFPNIRFVG